MGGGGGTTQTNQPPKKIPNLNKPKKPQNKPVFQLQVLIYFIAWKNAQVIGLLLHSKP